MKESKRESRIGTFFPLLDRASALCRDLFVSAFAPTFFLLSPCFFCYVLSIHLIFQSGFRFHEWNPFATINGSLGKPVLLLKHGRIGQQMLLLFSRRTTKGGM
jgi:hypothetical protein